jgi:hypothetical protein
MHEQAILTTVNALLGPAGTLLPISKIQAHYPTTAQANMGIDYKCADPNCGVRVKAIIPVMSRPGRKQSPSPYFAARWEKHKVGCTREPHHLPTTPTLPVSAQPAHPNRLAAPAAWIDPRIKSKAITTKTAAIGTHTPTTNITSGGRSTVGNGTSLGQSQMVERFSTAWKAMTVPDRKGSILKATWNGGGTYFSGFHPLWFHTHTSVETLGELIFVGTFNSIVLGSSGYTITLTEKHPDKNDLRIWVQNATFSVHPDGVELHNILAALKVSSPSQPITIYSFGSFSKQTSSTEKHTYYSLPVNHPHLIWLDI